MRKLNTHTRTKAGLAALLTATALALTACGSDSTSGDDKEIDGAKKATKSATPSASPSDDGIKRPKITLPSDVHNVFEGRETGDPKKDAVLADNERAINSIDEAITSDSPKHPGVKFYSKGDALASAAEYIKSFYDAGVTFTGTTRYYNRKVTFLKDSAAAVTYCSDETKAYSKDRKTKKVKKGAPSAKDYVFYNERMEKNESGVWQSARVISEEAAKQCQP
ncbi:hypothetical protein [Streptomyces sp. NPDC005322]|uniref:hypothetical protein n=1 Tax=Streptomyces sp. NPDC005322 TaxID=3157032 RepID=UPI0033AB209A